MSRFHTQLILLIFLSLILVKANAAGLIDVYSIAKTQDTELLEAEANYFANSQARPIARSALLPQLSLSAETSDNKIETRGETFGIGSTDADFNSNGYSLRLTQSLYNRSFYVQLRQAKNTVAKARVQLDSSKQDLILRVAEAYFNVLAAQDDLRFARSEKDAIGRQLEQAEKLFEVGLAPITDVKEAQSSFDGAIAREIESQNSLELAFDTLAVITGERLTDLDPLSEDIELVRPEPDNVDDWIDNALDQNLSLLINEYDTEIAKQQIALEQSGHLPTLDIVGSFRDFDTGGLSGSRKEKDRSIGIELNFPIFEGGNTYYSTKESQFLFKAAVQAHERIKRETTRDTRNAFHNVVSGISRVNALAKAVESAEIAAKASEAGFEVGTRTSVDVLLSVRGVFEAQRNHAQSRYDFLLDTLRLKRSAGSLNPDDLQQIDAWLQ
ncbi:MAG: TolC family outer membrane protein [Pseudomonadota bacterium]